MLLQKRWRWCTVYVSIFVSYLFRSHASSKPHKKKKKRFLSNPTQTCMLLYSRYHGREWSRQHATLTYFCMKLLLPLFRLSCFLFWHWLKKDIYRVLMIKRAAPDVHIRKKRMINKKQNDKKTFRHVLCKNLRLDSAVACVREWVCACVCVRADWEGLVLFDHRYAWIPL